MKVKKLIKFLDSIAPFESAENYDNVGLIIGSVEDKVNGILVCLDCTLAVVEYAIESKANVIISHHPLIFGTLNHIFTDEPKGAIIKKLLINKINLIAVHTNIDKADVGTAYATAISLGLKEIYSSQYDPYLRIAQLEDTITADKLNELAANKLHCNSRLYGDKQKQVKIVAIAPGSASESYITAISHQADAFICGEAKHHHILDACARGMVFIENGHHANEYPVVGLIYDLLTDKFNDISIYKYNKDPFIIA